MQGLWTGLYGLVDGIVRRIEKEMRPAPRIIATGGLAELMAEVTETIEAVEPHLTLEGLRIIYDHVPVEPHLTLEGLRIIYDHVQKDSTF